MLKMRKEFIILLIISFFLGIAPIFFHGNLYIMNILTICLIWAVVAASWDLIMGFAGIFSFGQVAFFVSGAYGSVILALNFGISPWFGILAGGAIASVIGILVCIPCLRLKGAYIALATFAIHMVLEPLIKSKIGIALGTGGALGLLGIPSLKIGGYVFSNMEPVPSFYAAMGIFLVSLLIIYKVIFSGWGLAFIALRDSEVFAKSLGVNDYKYKLLVFGVSAFLTGSVGAFYAHYVQVLSPRMLSFDLFLTLMVMLVLGGIGRFPGAVIGALIATFFSEILRPLETYRGLVFGGTVVLLVIFMPQGIMGILFQDRGLGLVKWIGRFARQKTN
jgi:branched-chain amino acid transport system permease protein